MVENKIVVDFTLKPDAKPNMMPVEDDDELHDNASKKDVFGIEYEIPLLVQTVQAVKAPDELGVLPEKQLYEVHMVAYADSPMVANMFSKVEGHFLKVKF